MRDFSEIFNQIYEVYGFDRRGEKKKLADALGVDANSIDRFRKKGANPTYKVLTKLINYCGKIDPKKPLNGHFLLSGEGQIYFEDYDLEKIKGQAQKFVEAQKLFNSKKV